MSALRAAFFVKNVPAWERVVRLIVSGAAILAGFSLLASPWGWLVAGGGVGFALTGLFGFCPACALAGRRLARPR